MMRWRLDALLKERRWTAYFLALRAGLTPSAVYKLMKKPDLRAIDTATLEKLAVAFDVKPWQLLDWGEWGSPDRPTKKR